jgi:hypothetical protein
MDLGLLADGFESISDSRRNQLSTFQFLYEFSYILGRLSWSVSDIRDSSCRVGRYDDNKLTLNMKGLDGMAAQDRPEGAPGENMDRLFPASSLR